MTSVSNASQDVHPTYAAAAESSEPLMYAVDPTLEPAPTIVPATIQRPQGIEMLTQWGEQKLKDGKRVGKTFNPAYNWRTVVGLRSS